MQYLPYHEIGSRPNIIVDGAAREATVLTLSHWPWNRTPEMLRRDTSTEIVFAYLDQPVDHEPAKIVSNSHYDEDGLLGIYALMAPCDAAIHRELIIATAKAGDFAVCDNLEAAKLSFVLAAFADPESSPLPESTFDCELRERVIRLYRCMLPRVPELISGLEGLAEYWEEEFHHFRASAEWIDSGRVLLDEDPQHDLAIVRIPEDIPKRTVRRYLHRWERPVHPFAVHNLTDCSRVLWIHGDTLEFQYRYESWVHLASRRPSLRVDLTGLADRFNELDVGLSRWHFDGIDQVAPRLRRVEGERSLLDEAGFLEALLRWLDTQPVAWDPYADPVNNGRQ